MQRGQAPPKKLEAIARALYTPPPDESELYAAGLRPEDFAGDAVDVWPENERAVAVFCQLYTQWRMGFNGPTGLDYNVLYLKLARLQLPPDDLDQIEADIRVLESEALHTINTQNAK